MKRHLRRKVKHIVITVILLVIALSGIFLINKDIFENHFIAKPSDSITRHPVGEDNGWNLILVNRDNYIPDDYEVELTKLSNGQKVDSRIYPKLQEMFDEARREGLGLFVAAGYRTREKQQELLDEKIREYENEGKTKKEAEKLAKEWVAVPGTSEHQLGIAVDINADTKISTRDEVYSWLSKNAYKYGFIQRYPSDKKDITGVINEPWHYRYVG